jgi:tetratricopeptide (TPR) repeat protein
MKRRIMTAVRARGARHSASAFAVHACLFVCLSVGLSVSGTISHAHAQSLDGIFRSGNSAYFEGRFGDAIKDYTKLVEAGVIDPDVYFNLATAYAREGQLGRAILYFERAARLAPGDSEVASALQITRSALGKHRAESQGEAMVEAKPPLRDALVQPYAENTLAYLLLACQVLLFGLLILRGFVHGEALRTGLALGAALAGLSVLATGLLLLQKRGIFDEGRAAVVLDEGIELREGPDPRARTRATAHEGASARVLARDGSFVRVRVQDGAEGWTAASAIGIVAPD